MFPVPGAPVRGTPLDLIIGDVAPPRRANAPEMDAGPADDLYAGFEPYPGFDPFDRGDEDDAPLPAPGWLGAIGQMTGAVLVVVGVVTLFIAVAVALRRLLP